MTSDPTSATHTPASAQLTVAAPSETHTFVDGDWHAGNPGVMGPRSHAFWLGSSVFDGARAFEGVTPDLNLHCARINSSARALGLNPTMQADEIAGLVQDGLKRFESRDAIYIRPMYWAEAGGFMAVPADPTSTRFLLCLHVSPMLEPTGIALGLSPFRRPTLECMPTDAKSGCLYPNNARAILEARSRGFDNALVRDMLGNVAETGTSNIFLVKDGVERTPASNGSFLSGITRARVIGLLRTDGVTVEEVTLSVDDFLCADELFMTGNHSKVVPVVRLEGQQYDTGPVGQRARALYWDWSHSHSS